MLMTKNANNDVIKDSLINRLKFLEELNSDTQTLPINLMCCLPLSRFESDSVALS